MNCRNCKKIYGFQTVRLVLFFALTISFPALGQNVKGLCHTKEKVKPKFEKLLLSYGIGKPKPTKNEIELRIWLSRYSTGQRQLVRLLKTNNHQWEAYYLEFYNYNSENYDFKNYVSDTLNIKSTWKNTWREIVENELFCVLDQDELHETYRKKQEQVIVTSDGNNWTFELYGRGIKKSVSYSIFLVIMVFIKETV